MDGSAGRWIKQRAGGMLNRRRIKERIHIYIYISIDRVAARERYSMLWSAKHTYTNKHIYKRFARRKLWLTMTRNYPRKSILTTEKTNGAWFSRHDPWHVLLYCTVWLSYRPSWSENSVNRTFVGNLFLNSKHKFTKLIRFMVCWKL